MEKLRLRESSREYPKSQLINLIKSVKRPEPGWTLCLILLENFNFKIKSVYIQVYTDRYRYNFIYMYNIYYLDRSMSTFSFFKKKFIANKVEIFFDTQP